jgi:hypothetical protein
MWKIEYCDYGSQKMEGLLSDGWEPFAVNGTKVWFRKAVP